MEEAAAFRTLIDNVMKQAFRPGPLNWSGRGRGLPMSDGREEREEREKRREQEERENRDDRLDPHPPDQWKPERPDS
jgi:hypothetical protein